MQKWKFSTVRDNLREFGSNIEGSIRGVLSRNAGPPPAPPLPPLVLTRQNAVSPPSPINLSVPPFVLSPPPPIKPELRDWLSCHPGIPNSGTRERYVRSRPAASHYHVSLPPFRPNRTRPSSDRSRRHSGEHSPYTDDEIFSYTTFYRALAERKMLETDIYGDGVEAPRFRMTRIHHVFINGYIHRQQDLEYIFCEDVQMMIMQYANFYFVKLSYDKMNQSAETYKKQNKVERRVQKHVHSNVQEVRYFALQRNQTFRQIIRRLEKLYEFDYDRDDVPTEAGKQPEHYCYFIRLWAKFKYMKTIYPLKMQSISSDITMDMIEKCEHETRANPERWVEIPNDFEDATIMDFDELIAKFDKHGLLELGVDRYDICTDQWMFCDTDRKYEHQRLSRKDAVNDACLQSIESNDWVHCVWLSGVPRDTALLSLWTGIENTMNKKPVISLRPKRAGDEALVYVQAVCPIKLAAAQVDVKMFINGTAVTARVIDAAEEQQWIHRHCTRTNRFKSHSKVPPLSTAPRPRAERRRLRHWKCVHCGARNDKTYVICGGCFVGKEDGLYDSGEWTEHLQIGDIVNVRDQQEQWYEAVIRYIAEENGEKVIYIHYIGRDKKYDEKVPVADSERVAKRNSKTMYPHRPKRVSTKYKPKRASSVYPAFATRGKEAECALHGLPLYRCAYAYAYY